MRILLACLFLFSCTAVVKSDPADVDQIKTKLAAIPMNEKVNLTNDEWKKILSPMQFHVMREAGTETAFRNEYWNNHEKGIFVCAGCGNELFKSETKYESGTGWPSFYQPIAKEKVAVSDDKTLGVSRDEVTCARCGGHLGHVFDDGPQPTGLRYCMNSASLKLEKSEPK